MPALGERDDDELFDFSDQMFIDDPNSNVEETKPIETHSAPLSMETEVHTSYILANALLNLLVQKGIINSSEVNALVAELHAQFMRKKRG